MVEQTTVHPALPGYYRVVVTAASSIEARGVQGEIHAERWLWIDGNGGKVTTHFDPGLFPDSVMPQSGPFRKRWRYQTRGGTAANTAQTLVNETRTWEVTYYDQNTATYPKLRNAWVTGYILTVSGQTPVNEYTDGSGRFTTDCDMEIEYYYNLEVRAQNWNAVIGPNTTVASYAESPTNCTSVVQLVALSAESHAFTNVHITDSATFVNFGRERSTPARVRLTGCPEDTSWSCYHFGTADTIYLSSSHAWSAYYTAHEYGHSVHETVFGGVAVDLSGACASHGSPVYTNLECALTEGFADYFASRVRPEAYAWGTDLENNYYLTVNPNGDYPTDPNDPNGSRIEGAVAAFLHDLTDGGSGESFDNVAFPGSYIGDVLATCQVTNNGSTYQRPKGIDHLTYCLETSVDTAISGYFYGRATHPVGQSETATEPTGWSATVVRNLWKKDLYNQ